MKNSRIIILFLFITNQLLSQSSDCSHPTDAFFLKGIWVGEFTQYSCGLFATYPMTIEIASVAGNKFSGNFIWKDMPVSPDSRTTLEGEIIANKIFLYEENIVSGSNIVLGGVYEIATLDCASMAGNWRIKKLQNNCNDVKALEDGGKFVIRKLSPPKTSLSLTKRPVTFKHSIEVESKFITVKLWDNAQEDGDIVDLRINGDVALSHILVQKEPREIILPLLEIENTLELFAKNEGSIPPNTAAISIYSNGVEIINTVLKSDMKVSEGIKILRK